MAVAFGKMFAFLAVRSAGQEASNASCASQDATSHLQVHSGGTKRSEDSSSISPWCFQQPCHVVKVLCLAEDKCCDLAKVCVPVPAEQNPCAGKKPEDGVTPGDKYFKNQPCEVNGIKQTLEQSGINVTDGYLGQFNTSVPVPRTPILTNYSAAGLCAVNVHWHLGAEHYSVGQYDVENSTLPPVPDAPDGGYGLIQEHYGEKKAAVRHGFSCSYYNSSNPNFKDDYVWQHCKDMRVGETYEVHWPHSAAGDCGTQWQYQTPFYDGVFCKPDIISLTNLNTWKTIGVQAQVFTIINDEQYFYPDLFKGMIVDSAKDLGTDIAHYTGSTTGTSRSNEVCSRFTPITWQVDRKCHLISASSFDQMCKEMKAQSDDMTEDLHAHGSRELVDIKFAADNLQLFQLQNERL